MHKIIKIGFIITIMAAIAGCDKQSAPAESESPAAVNQEQSAPVEQIAEAIADNQNTVALYQGDREMIIAKNPQRIVALDFGTLDTLEELNLANRVVAVPKSNVPDYLDEYKDDRYASAGNMKELNFDAIKQLTPDLIIITGRQNQSYAQLAEIAPTINLGVNGKNYLPSFKSNVQFIGELFDKQSDAKEALADLDKKMADYQAKANASDLKALVVLHNANKLNSANTSNYATVIHDLAGIKRADANVEPKRQAADEAYLTAINPDIIFVVDRGAAIGQDKFDLALFDTEALKNLDAYKNDRIVYLTPDLWYLSGGGLESLSLQLDEAIAALD